MILINFVKKNEMSISLKSSLILDFKNREFVDLRAHNFADVTFLKYKISTM